MSEEKVVIGNVSVEQVDAWKAEYGKVYKVVVDGKLYVYRGLTRKEWRGIQSKYFSPMVGVDPEKSEQMENDIVTTCILYPEKLEFEGISAGTPGTLADCISEISGFRVDSAPEEL